MGVRVTHIKAGDRYRVVKTTSSHSNMAEALGSIANGSVKFAMGDRALNDECLNHAHEVRA